MTDAQFAILVSVVGGGLTGLIGMLRWAVNRLSGALDGNTAAHLKNAEAMAAMSTKLDFVYQATGKVEDFIKEEISGVTVAADDVTPTDKPRGRYHIKRPKSQPGGG